MRDARPYRCVMSVYTQIHIHIHTPLCFIFTLLSYYYHLYIYVYGDTYLYISMYV